MVIALFGDSCTSKSTIAEQLAQALSVEVFSGKDDLKLAESESIAAALFKKKQRHMNYAWIRTLFLRKKPPTKFGY